MIPTLPLFEAMILAVGFRKDSSCGLCITVSLYAISRTNLYERRQECATQMAHSISCSYKGPREIQHEALKWNAFFF